MNLAPPTMRADRALHLAIRCLIIGAVEREFWVAWGWNTDGAM